MTGSDAGTSMIAAIVAIGLTTLGLGLVSGVARATVETVAGMMELSRNHAALLDIDSAILKAVGRITQPVWLPNTVYRRTLHRISIPFVDGDPTLEMHLSWDNQGIAISVGETNTVFAGISVREAEVVTGSPAHLRLTIALPNGTPVTVAAPFGLCPVPTP